MDTGTTAFLLICVIGLTLMIPGLALFYGGMVSVKSSVNMGSGPDRSRTTSH